MGSSTKAHRKCWTCGQTATHVMTREGSNTLHACDNCTRIDRAEAESRGWVVAAIRKPRPSNPYSAATPGQAFVKAVTSLNHIGPRTRRWRKHEDLFEVMLADVRNTISYPGMWSKEREDAIRPAWTAVGAYWKHIDGGRIDAVKCSKVQQMRPYEFAKFLGRMIDAGISNMGEAETWLKQAEI